MQRYFFHIIDGRTIIDTEGAELPHLAAVQDEAFQTSTEMLKSASQSSEFWSGESWTLNVVDEASQPVLTLRFSAQVHRKSEVENPDRAA